MSVLDNKPTITARLKQTHRGRFRLRKRLNKVGGKNTRTIAAACEARVAVMSRKGEPISPGQSSPGQCILGPLIQRPNPWPKNVRITRLGIIRLLRVTYFDKIIPKNFVVTLPVACARPIRSIMSQLRISLLACQNCSQ